MTRIPTDWRSALSMMTDAEIAELKKIIAGTVALPSWLAGAIRAEIRESFRTDPPQPVPPFDADAEAEVLNSIWWGVPPSDPPEPEEYFATVHRGLAEVMASARSIGINPTIALVMRGLDALGIRSPGLEGEVRRLLEPMPVAMEPDRAATKVKALAWRRRLVRRLDRLRALLSSRETTDAEIERELDSFVEEAAAQAQEAT